MNQNWSNQTVENVAQHFSVDLGLGLTDKQVEENTHKFGFNELKEKEKETLLTKIINQLKDLMIIILMAASVVSAIVGEVADAAVIIAIIVINAVLGIVQEGKAEKALEALQKMSAPNAKTLRNGAVTVIPARNVVPGDILLIEAGDIIPADARIFESANLKIEEASLTGESVPSEKDGSAVLAGDVGIGDRVNMVFSSTICTYGRGKALVVGTGSSTEIGKIADKIQEIEAEQTPLQKNLEQLGKWLGIICLAICAVVFAVGLLRGGNVLEMFMVAVSLAVAAIPEGLPAVVTIVLALGMKKMVDRNAIVRKLLAVETLGCVDIICSDKTGTLTQNEMTVKKIFVGSSKYNVDGQGYDPTGDFLTLDDDPVVPDEIPDLKTLLTIGVLCNDAVLDQKGDFQYGIVGDPTEGALIVAGAKAGYIKAKTNTAYPRISEIPFDSERKMMTTFHSNFMPGVVSFTKGAPDIIVDKCSYILINGEVKELTKDIHDEIEQANSIMAHHALRVLAFAYRQYDSLPANQSSESIENNMIFVGLQGMIDPARSEAKHAIAVCHKAGIKAVMITGDHKDTAVAIAKELKLYTEGDGVLTGHDLDHLSPEELQEKVETTSVYARVSPEHKVDIVEMLRKNGHIASMTGDGVNDAMALKRADIGVAMGITGTDVAKGSSDMILTDDNFASIVSAVEEGRIIYSNIRKFVFFLLSCNVGEILIVFLSILIGLPVPLVPIQLLWLNLVTDSFPALALGTEKGDPDIMQYKPRKSDEPILNRAMIYGIIVQSGALLVAVLGAYLFALGRFPDYMTNADHMAYARTYAFVTLICSELFRCLSSRSENFTIAQLGLFTNKIIIAAIAISTALLLIVVYLPAAQPIFDTFPMSLSDWGIIAMFCFIPLIAGELYKVIRRNVVKTKY